MLGWDYDANPQPGRVQGLGRARPPNQRLSHPQHEAGSWRRLTGALRLYGDELTALCCSGPETFNPVRTTERSDKTRKPWAHRPEVSLKLIQTESSVQKGWVTSQHRPQWPPGIIKDNSTEKSLMVGQGRLNHGIYCHIPKPYVQPAHRVCKSMFWFALRCYHTGRVRQKKDTV